MASLTSLQQRRRSAASQSRSGIDDDDMSSRTPILLPPIRVEPVDHGLRGGRAPPQDDKKAYFDSFEGKTDLERLRKLKTDLMNNRAPYRSYPRSADLEWHMVARGPSTSVTLTAPPTQSAPKALESAISAFSDERSMKDPSDELSISAQSRKVSQEGVIPSNKQAPDQEPPQSGAQPQINSTIEDNLQTSKKRSIDAPPPGADTLQTPPYRAGTASPLDGRSSQLSNYSDAMEVDLLLAPVSPSRESNVTPSLDFPEQSNPWVDLPLASTSTSDSTPKFSPPIGVEILPSPAQDPQPVRLSRFAPSSETTSIPVNASLRREHPDHAPNIAVKCSSQDGSSLIDIKQPPALAPLKLNGNNTASVLQTLVPANGEEIGPYHRSPLTVGVTLGPSRTPSQTRDGTNNPEASSSPALESSDGSDLGTPIDPPPHRLPVASSRTPQVTSSRVPFEGSLAKLASRPSPQALAGGVIDSVPTTDRTNSQVSPSLRPGNANQVPPRPPKSGPRTSKGPQVGRTHQAQQQARAAKHKAMQAKKAAAIENRGPPKGMMGAGVPPQRTQAPTQTQPARSDGPPPLDDEGDRRSRALIERFKDPSVLERNTSPAFRAAPKKDWPRDNQPGRPFPIRDDPRRNGSPGRPEVEDFGRGRPSARDWQRNTMPSNRTSPPPLGGRQYFDVDGYRARPLARSPSPLGPGGNPPYASGVGGRSLKRTRDGSLDLEPHRTVMSPWSDPSYGHPLGDRRPYPPPEIPRYDDQGPYYRWRERSPPPVAYGRDRYREDWDEYDRR